MGMLFTHSQRQFLSSWFFSFASYPQMVPWSGPKGTNTSRTSCPYTSIQHPPQPFACRKFKFWL